MQNIIATAMQRQRLERARSNHGTTDSFDVRVIGPPEIPFFQLYFRPPRMRSSRGLIFLPIRVVSTTGAAGSKKHLT